MLRYNLILKTAQDPIRSPTLSIGALYNLILKMAQDLIQAQNFGL